MLDATFEALAADLAADRLWTLGVRGIEERDCGDAGNGTGRSGRAVVELRTSVGEDDAAIARAVSALDPGWQSTGSLPISS